MRIFALLWACLLPVLLLQAQGNKKRKPAEAPQPALSYDSALYQALQWRSIGPFRGGRSAAVTGVPGQPQLFYFGSTGGGVWRTRDGGRTYENISDGYFGGSIGAVEVSTWDPNVIYVGGGEKTVRGNVSYGYGMWKSVDAGKSWQQIGLSQARHIPRVRVHPRDPDLVYAAVLGDLFQPGEMRGVYRSRDGGQTWERVLFANADAGAIDLLLDPHNPRVIYASTWRVRRTPYSLESGGEGSALWHSTDGGDTWTELTRTAKGLPTGTLGIIGIAASPAQRDRLWAIVEAEQGGVYRSDDGGDTWTRTNEDRALRQRAWYYSRIYADPQDPDKVYVVNVNYHRSTDGGRTFKAFSAPHGDHHDLWIAPEDPQRMIIGDDGGAQISYDGGETWSTYYNQPTAQFYRVTADNHFPYRLYVAQQDNSTLRIAHRTDGYSISERDWEETAGGESAHIAVDPDNDDIVYGGSYGGYLERVDHRSGERRLINVWPDNPLGYGAEGMRYRFQWNFPIFFSPHDSDKLYACSNHLHVSEDEGQSWKTISPDLTRNDSSKLGPSGGPITKDNTGVEYYCTIFAAVESPYEAGVIWTGSDDGLLHLSRDGGQTWDNVTPPATLLPEWTMINSIEADPFVKGGAYVAATRYKLGDYRPYLLRTRDYGKTWSLITQGIAAEHFTRVVRADPDRQGLLYCGTESGMYISFDDGASWRSFQLDLPVVPITDLLVKQRNLVAATQGRSLWIIDDLGPLHQLSEAVAGAGLHLFAPQDAQLMRGSGRPGSKTEGTNHPGGLTLYYHLRALPADSVPVRLVLLDADGNVIRTFDRSDKAHKDRFKDLKAGMNTFNWDLRYPEAKTVEGMVIWFGETRGPRAVPGSYRARLVVGSDSVEQPFRIVADPRLPATQADYQAQFDFLMQVRDKLTATHEVIIDIRAARTQLSAFKAKVGDDAAYAALAGTADTLIRDMTAVEEALYQTKLRSSQDPLNYPIRLNNKLAHLGALSSYSDYRPTQQALQFLDEVSAAIDAELAVWQTIVSTRIPAFNQQVKSTGVDLIMLGE
ncbi:MAG: hypothetical protein OHK0039_03410 [Bacteroidia bacterium]